MVKSSSQRVSPGLHCWVPQRPSRQNSPVAQSSATKPVPASLQRFRWVEETQPRTWPGVQLSPGTQRPSRQTSVGWQAVPSTQVPPVQVSGSPEALQSMAPSAQSAVSGAVSATVSASVSAAAPVSTAPLSRAAPVSVALPVSRPPSQLEPRQMLVLEEALSSPHAAKRSAAAKEKTVRWRMGRDLIGCGAGGAGQAGALQAGGEARLNRRPRHCNRRRSRPEVPVWCRA